jgi:hypothetical protein
MTERVCGSVAWFFWSGGRHEGEPSQGTLIEVSEALKTDSWLVSWLEYVVQPVDRPNPSDAPMTVDIDLKSEWNLGLDESIYVPTE